MEYSIKLVNFVGYRRLTKWSALLWKFMNPNKLATSLTMYVLSDAYATWFILSNCGPKTKLS